MSDRDDTVSVEAEAEAKGGATPSAGSASSGPPKEFLRAATCDGFSPVGIESDVCTPLAPTDVQCEAGMTPVLPLWTRTFENGAWTPWVLVDWYSCPSESDLFALIEREWTSLQLASPDVNLQPDTGEVLATVPTIAFVDADPLTRSAVLLGADVDIRATPATFTWSWGDGESTTTTDPGAPYPGQTVTHAYSRATDSATVTLTTTWEGQYRVAGGAWTGFDATVATESDGIVLEVLHPRARLVDGPLR